MPRVIGFLWLVLTFNFSVHGENRSWREEAGFRWAELAPVENGKTGFTLLPSEQTGLAFTNQLGERAIAANRVLANGSGVAVGDFNNDGLPDLYFCGLETPNVLYQNLGNWKFLDVTKTAGVACADMMSRGAVFADLNGNGFLDLLVSTLDSGVLCFFNQGNGTFTDATAFAGTGSDLGGMTLALADVDGNGTLDLYIANNRPNDIRDRGRVAIPMVRGQPAIPPRYKNRLLLREGQLAEYGQPDQLLLNSGNGKFEEISWTGGAFLDEEGRALTEPPLDWGLAATFRDVTGNLAPDLYVCNDFWTQDRFWINDGTGRFRAVKKTALRKTSASSMGIDFADLDRDGNLDFFVVDMLSRDPRLRKRQMLAQKPAISVPGEIETRPQVMRNTLFRNRGDGTFSELADYSGLSASDWSWSPMFVDVTLNGYEDLLISAGHFRDVQDLDAEQLIRSRQRSFAGYTTEAARQAAFTRDLMEHYRLYPPLEMPVIAFENQGDWNFSETTGLWGLDKLGVYHGMALGDFDLDGDLDLVVNRLNGPAAIFRNDTGGSRVKVLLKGLPPNTGGIGSKVTLLNGAVPAQTTEIVSGGRYLSGSEAVAVFAAGARPAEMSLEIRWRGGRESVIANVKSGRVYEVFEPEAAPSSQLPLKKNSSPRKPFFEDVSASLAHTHHELDFNDFERQPLLPFKLSQSGPGAAWFDLTGNGRDELIIGSGRGGTPAVFQTDGAGKFTALEWTGPASVDDTAGLVGWRDRSGKGVLLAGLTGQERNLEHAVATFRIEENRLMPGSPLAVGQSSAGPLSLGDLSGNGALALFVGGGPAPGSYPFGAPSKIYRHDGTEWRLDARNSLLLENIGIVNGAIWSDLDGNGYPDLILACEWGPVRVFRNERGTLFEATEQWGLKPYTGWWKGVAAADVNNNGKMDLIAVNWGLNSPYQASLEQPLVFYAGQLFQPGITDIIETEYDPRRNSLIPRRSFSPLTRALPFLSDQFATHKDFSEATLDEAFGPRLALARRFEATTLASMVFINSGDHFEAVTLPLEAQLSPAFSVHAADFNGDGFEDLFLTQNFFPLRPESPRLDAGEGLWLQGDGAGKFAAVPGSLSGIQIYGEQRGAALGDFDQDGRVDLVVTQNGAATKLFRNTGAAPGLRVRLEGPAQNPLGVGAVLRLQFKNHSGAARQIHAGSGYGSQDSAVQIMATPEQPETILIRWPGGKSTTTAIPENSKEIAVNFDGQIVEAR